MSHDFIEDAADILENQDFPWLIIMGIPGGSVIQCNLSNENYDKENIVHMCDKLRDVANQLESGEMKGWIDNE